MLVLDVETTKAPKFLPWLPGSYIVSVHGYDGKNRYTWLFNHPEALKTFAQNVSEIQQMVDNTEMVGGHNFKFDMHWLQRIGVDMTRICLYDTIVAEYIIKMQDTTVRLSLDKLAERYDLPLKLDIVKSYWDSGYDTDEVPAHMLSEYGEWDCVLTYLVREYQLPIIKEMGLERVISMEMEMLRVLVDIEFNGMMVDISLLEYYSKEYEIEIEKCDEELSQLLGDINLSSGDQLSCVLYGGTYQKDGVETVNRTLKSGKIRTYERKCQIPVVVKGLGIKPLPKTELKKSGFYSTSAPTLKQLKCTTKIQKRVVQLIQERAKLVKLKSTYFDKLLEDQIDGYIYPSLNQCRTATSRLSCSNPNNQTIPRITNAPVKKVFISRY